MIYVVLYLAAIVLANILILLYNPDTVSMTWALVAETGISFFLIGLDLSIRDKLHDYWQNRNLWPKMVTLIVSGSLITIFFNDFFVFCMNINHIIKTFRFSHGSRIERSRIISNSFCITNSFWSSPVVSVSYTHLTLPTKA